jgi:hypothetical protein
MEATYYGEHGEFINLLPVDDEIDALNGGVALGARFVELFDDADRQTTAYYMTDGDDKKYDRQFERTTPNVFDRELALTRTRHIDSIETRTKISDYQFATRTIAKRHQDAVNAERDTLNNMRAEYERLSRLMTESTNRLAVLDRRLRRETKADSYAHGRYIEVANREGRYR